LTLDADSDVLRINVIFDCAEVSRRELRDGEGFTIHLRDRQISYSLTVDGERLRIDKASYPPAQAVRERPRQ
jgi:hypothetical protein